MALSNRDRVAESLGRLADGLAPFVARLAAGLRRRAGSRRPCCGRLRSDEEFRDGAVRDGDRFRARVARCRRPGSATAAWRSASPTPSAPSTQPSGCCARRGRRRKPRRSQESLTEFLRLAADRRSRKVDRASVILPGMEGLGLKPWRQVIRPHRDIVDGNFNASQFAANLYNVVNGKATLRVPGSGRVLPPHLPDRRTAGPARARPSGVSPET